MEERSGEGDAGGSQLENLVGEMAYQTQDAIDNMGRQWRYKHGRRRIEERIDRESRLEPLESIAELRRNPSLSLSVPGISNIQETSERFSKLLTSHMYLDVVCAVCNRLFRYCELVEKILTRDIQLLKTMKRLLVPGPLEHERASNYMAAVKFRDAIRNDVGNQRL